MGNERDVFEWRRLGHWDSSAAKARFSAYAFWKLRDDTRISEMADQCAHQRGDASLAVSETFRRECAIALELVVKAVIARRFRSQPTSQGIPATHDLPQLWNEAQLPRLPKEDLYRLQLVKSWLMWSGRYATPRTVEAWEKENAEFGVLEDPPKQRFGFSTPIAIGWNEFDRLYQLAAEKLR